MKKERYINRSISDKLLKLFKYFPSIAITGARQVGKTTLLKHLFPDYNNVVFDPVIDVEGARSDPELFLENNKTPLILDEIQYCPELVPVIKRKIDENRAIPGQYIITGSQQWGVLKTISESLAGRVAFLDLDGLSLSEVENVKIEKPWLERFLEDTNSFFSSKQSRIELKDTLFEILWKGALPKLQFLPLDLIKSFHFGYQRTYIERDIRLLADISDLQLFSRFVRLMAAYSAKEINFRELGRELGISSKTAKRWLNLLKETFQWHEYPAYSGNVIKRISLKPKGYFLDTGQICFCQGISSPLSLGAHPFLGFIFETFVAGEIRKQSYLMETPPNIYHWRSFSGAECDLILERDGKFFPIEIKIKSRPSRKDTTGISAFRRTYPNLKIEKGLVISTTQKVFQISDNDYAIPFDLK